MDYLLIFEVTGQMISNDVVEWWLSHGNFIYANV